MFNENEDWNDEEEAQFLSKTVVSATLESKSSEHIKVYCCMCRFPIFGSVCIYLHYTHTIKLYCTLLLLLYIVPVALMYFCF